MEAPLPFALVVAAVIVLVLLLELKTSRSDGELVADVPKFRRMMQFIMPSRNESVVYFDRAVRAENLEAYLEAVKGPLGANLTHVLVGAFNIGLAENPKMNQFVVGRRLYRRNGRFLTFSMKRQKGKKKAKLSAVKLQMQDGETFKQLCDRINGGIKVERSGEKTAADKEYDLLDLLPRPGLRAMNKLLQRTVAAYRPLYLHGLLLDGQYRLPKADSPPAFVGSASTGWPRTLSEVTV